jgi:hypothetical protein|tara:strand:- start:4647 stop:4844 length:198 start_codon:yes stop_codon:yes gene_type:complete
MNTKYKEGQTVNYRLGDMHANGKVVSVKSEMVGGAMQNVYLVSEGNGGQNMKYVPENEILTLLNG